jgi:hypothetical protein
MMRTKSKIYFLLITLLLIALIPQTSRAYVLDQEYLPYYSLIAQARSIDYWGQSFTVSKTGILERVDIAVSKEQGVTADMDFYVFRIINGIAQVSSGIGFSIPNAMLPTDTSVVPTTELLQIDLAPYHFSVQAGDVVGMLVHSTIGFNERPMINWRGGCDNNSTQQCGSSGITQDGYTRGTPLQKGTLSDFSVFPRNDFDFGFRSFVKSPVANAGSNQVVFGQATLDGSASQGNILSWNWTLTHQTNPAYRAARQQARNR